MRTYFKVFSNIKCLALMNIKSNRCNCIMSLFKKIQRFVQLSFLKGEGNIISLPHPANILAFPLRNYAIGSKLFLQQVPRASRNVVTRQRPPGSRRPDPSPTVPRVWLTAPSTAGVVNKTARVCTLMPFRTTYTITLQKPNNNIFTAIETNNYCFGSRVPGFTCPETHFFSQTFLSLKQLYIHEFFKITNASSEVALKYPCVRTNVIREDFRKYWIC